MKLPLLSRPQAVEFLKNNYPALDPSSQVIVLGLRGYFDPGANKRGIYDDAIALITPDLFHIVNGNTDPSIARAGIAVLQDGIYWYRKGLHGLHHLDTTKQADRDILKKIDDIDAFQKTWVNFKIPGRILPYWALRQDGNVTVLRDGQKVPFTDAPPQARLWIDIHVGEYDTTSSEGCQTIFPDYWSVFRKLCFTQMDIHKQQRIAYALKTVDIAIESLVA